jgi:hypothetical protein
MLPALEFGYPEAKQTADGRGFRNLSGFYKLWITNKIIYCKL